MSKIITDDMIDAVETHIAHLLSEIVRLEDKNEELEDDNMELKARIERLSDGDDPDEELQDALWNQQGDH